MSAEPTKQDDRSLVANMNADALIALLRDYGITLPRNAAAWRPTLRVEGTFPSLALRATILCTDGVVGWFLLAPPNYEGEARASDEDLCPHDETDHYICLSCGENVDPNRHDGSRSALVDSGKLFFAHVANFDGEVKPLFSVTEDKPAATPAKPKPRRNRKLAAALDLLEQLQNDL